MEKKKIRVPNISKMLSSDDLKLQEFVSAEIALRLIFDAAARLRGIKSVSLPQKVFTRMGIFGKEKKHPMLMCDSGHFVNFSGQNWLLSLGRWIGGNRYRSVLLAFPLSPYAQLHASSAADAITFYNWGAENVASPVICHASESAIVLNDLLVDRRLELVLEGIDLRRKRGTDAILYRGAQIGALLAPQAMRLLALRYEFMMRRQKFADEDLMEC